MKLKKLLLIFPLLFGISGCNSNDSFIGKYSFQLGADDKTHVGIHLELFDTPVTVEGKPDAKKYSMTFEVGGSIFGAIQTAMEDTDIPLSTSEDTSSTTSDSSESSPISINGYYTVEKKKDGEQLLHLGVTFFEELTSLTIPDSIVDKIMYATISDNVVNVVIPVSLVDLQYQLYWYGYRVSNLLGVISPTKLVDEDPLFNGILSGNDIGTHPSQTAIKSINIYQNKRKTEKPANYEDGEDIFAEYRDFHTIQMGFTK